MIIHVQQPTPTSCAQACVAMVLAKPIDIVIRELPHRPTTGTTHRALIAYLQAHGVRCADHLTSAVGKRLPDLCIVRVTWIHERPKRAHIVVKHGDTWHDPIFEAPFRQWKPIVGREYARGRITSFLEVSRP